ncbi:Putative Zn-dependent protease, contains TPR repeats [Bosea sp. CRIB-10]|uniref:M48 family metalloprotease n=1 Tax=Bosea sp. CRIB-10 TaxID=378404 RepID=UPI0008E63674|nr:M48 family metalloprotease [Bosea sp. CRIB-10]SFB66407.1 Putative Zn-dependent protease, contains TPR repeats [Bosea sp. CRIB-10]
MQPFRLLRPNLVRLRRSIAVGLTLVAAAAPVMAQAQKRSVSLIRDAEIEQLLRDYAAPIFKAAGINAGGTRIILINDRAFNAFVADGKSIFVNIGVLMDAATPNEVIGVLAHESGHLAGGHLARLRQEMQNAQILSIAGLLVGVGGVVAGARSGGSAIGNAGVGAMGAIAGPQELVRRSLLAYQRSEEQAADRAAVRFLSVAGMSAKGMLTVFRRFAENSAFLSKAIDPYTLSHPMPSERIAQLETLAKQSPHFDKLDPPALQARHDLMRAKLMGFVEREAGVARRYGMADQSMAARYARAISDYRSGRMAQALAAMDRLIGEQPKNAYFLELKGQALLEAGRAREAVPVLRQAVALAPQAGLIRQMLGHALQQTGDKALLDEAIRELSNAAAREPDSAEVHQHLSNAYAAKGNIAMAELSAARHAFAKGDWTVAHTQASRALAKLPQGSPAALRARDIVEYVPPDKQR